MMRIVRRYARLYGAFVGNCLRREMSFNTNFIAMIIADMFILGTSVLFFSIVYSKVDTLGGWTHHETLFFLGTFGVIDSVNMMVLMHNALGLPEQVRCGNLDFVLLRPVNPQFFVMTRHFYVAHISETIAGIALIVYAWPHAAAGASLGRLLLYIALGINGVLILGIVLFLLTMPCLWMVQSDGLMKLDSVFMFSLKPDGIYGRVAWFILTVIVPMTVIASFPSRLMFRAITPAEIIWSFISTGLAILASRALWNYGLRRYEGASS